MQTYKTKGTEFKGLNFPIGYDFCEWQKCFAFWKEFVANKGDLLQLVISTHPYSSGYWIEKKGTNLTSSDRCYIGKEVDELEKRIIKELEQARVQERAMQFIL